MKNRKLFGKTKHGLSKAGTKEYSRFKRYGVTPQQFDRMWREQNGRCSICAAELAGGAGKHAIDHNHQTGRVRELLCLKCNVCLGWFEAYRDIATVYLQRHDKPASQPSLFPAKGCE